MILKSRSIILLSVVLGLDLAACSKHPSGRYVCRQDAFEFKLDGTFTMSDAKTGALERKGWYKINSDRISLIPEKGSTVNGIMKGDSIIVEGLPPLTKQGGN